MITKFDYFIMEGLSATKYDDAIEIINNKCLEDNYEFLGLVANDFNDNVKSKDKLIIKCNKHNHVWYPRFEPFKNNRAGCIKCGREKSAIKNTIPEEIGTERIINKCEEKGYKFLGFVDNKWKGKTTKLVLYCPIEGHGKWSTTDYDGLVNSDKGCRFCGDEKSRNSKRFSESKATVDILDKCKEKGYDFLGFVGGKYINNKTNIILNCRKEVKGKVHGKWATANYKSLITKEQGCPICNESKGAREVSRVLEKLGFEYINIFDYDNIKDKNKKCFIREYTFNDCISNIESYDKKRTNKLPFDFYLPDHNLCIEYDGEQHFTPRFGSKDDKTFLMTKENDEIKNNYCSGKDGRPNLLRIKYTDYKNVEEILINYLNSY